MANFTSVLSQLQKERNRAEAQVQRLDEAIQVLQSLGMDGRRRTGGRPAVRPRSRRKLSRAARNRIAAAQMARWAKLKAKRLRKTNRGMSQAARNRIAAAQRARWAKVRQQARKNRLKRSAQAVQRKPSSSQKVAV